MAFCENRTVQAFSKHQESLSAVLGDPQAVAQRLLSRNLISRTAKDRACHPTKSVINRQMSLMAGIRERLSEDPSSFDNLLSVLREWPELVPVSDKLQAEILSDVVHIEDECSTLTPKHLVKLYILLEGVAHLWLSIGLAVGVAEGHLQKLRQECWRDKTRLWEVLRAWVEGESPKLEQLTKGLGGIPGCNSLLSSINASSLGHAGFGKHWLHPKNLSILHSTLLPLSPRWKELGHELGFLEGELVPIANHRGLASQDQRLQELLRQWLAWAPPKHTLPFSEDILAALIQLGEPDMASLLEQVMFGSEGNEDLSRSEGSENYPVPGDAGTVNEGGKGAPSQLVSSHLPPLYAHMKALGPKWRDIGIKLGFSVEELKKIAKENSLFDCYGHLQELLRRWLEWTPPLHCYPQMQDLSRVLCSIGEDTLALKLEHDAAFFSSPVLSKCHKLHSSHLESLLSVLMPLSPRWKDLATLLGFVHSDLRSVEHSHGLFKDDQYLREMLKRWLAWGPPKPSIATVEGMVSALEALEEYPMSLTVRDMFTHHEPLDPLPSYEDEPKKCYPYDS